MINTHTSTIIMYKMVNGTPGSACTWLDDGISVNDWVVWKTLSGVLFDKYVVSLIKVPLRKQINIYLM